MEQLADVFTILGGLAALLQFGFAHWKHAKALAKRITGQEGLRFRIVSILLFLLRVFSTWVWLFCLCSAIVLMVFSMFRGPGNKFLGSSLVLLLAIGLAGLHAHCGLSFWEKSIKPFAWCCFGLTILMVGCAVFEFFHRFLWML